MSDRKKKIRRITVKIGTRVLTDKDNRIDRKSVREISGQISDLMDRGFEVIVVSSGAIGAGLGLLATGKEGKSLSELQAIASIGQTHLMDMYNASFNKRGYVAGQILLTQEDLNDRKRFLNVRYTINTLLSYKAVPIVNENDSVSTEEIKFGDNDRLSSLVADLAYSDLLIVLTDVEGLYDDNGEMVPEVSAVTGRIKKLCKGKGCRESTGGMLTKLEAVKNAASAGMSAVIASGRRKNVLIDILDGKSVGTRFHAKEVAMKARKRWIAFGSRARGEIVVDTGAESAITKGNKSLLPSGIVRAEGRFHAGAVVEIANSGGEVVARGVSNYSSDEIEKIKGKRSDRIEIELGYKDYDEVVHRDNMVVLEGDS